MLERGIGAAFAAEKLAVHILRTIQGPHTLTTALRLYQPTAGNIRKAERMGPSIEAHTGAGPVRVYSNAGIVYVEAPSPQPVAIPGATLRGDGLAVPIGMTSLRAIAGWDAEREPHLLLVGPTGRGKTTAARGLVYHLTRQNTPAAVRFIVTTFKPRDWEAIEALTHTMAVITDVDEAAAMIAWMVETMYRRTRDRVENPHLFVILDDLLNLLSKKPDVGALLADLASLGRGAGIHLIVGTQRTGRKGTGDAAVTGNITARLIFGTASAQDAALFTGRGGSGADLLGRHPGDAMLITEGNGIQRVAVGLVTADDLAGLPGHGGPGRRPWLRTGAPPARTAETAQNGGVAAGAPVHLPRDRPPTAEEAAYLRRLYATLGSKNQVLRAAWGTKSSRYLDWLNQALQAEAT